MFKSNKVINKSVTNANYIEENENLIVLEYYISYYVFLAWRVC